MGIPRDQVFLVGDNPFLGISHLSQQRARDRGEESSRSKFAADLIEISLANGANGFMFSVCDTNLAILNEVYRRDQNISLNLCGIVPYAYEYVRLAAQAGGVSGIVKNHAKQLLLSGNMMALWLGLKGLLKPDLESLIESYLIYELHRIKSLARGRSELCSLMLHQTMTDMALALDMEWFFKLYVEFLLNRGVTPGFNTGNFAYLVNKCKQWNIDLQKLLIAAPFNKVGFQMNPSKEDCEKALSTLSEPTVIAISILAAGYMKPKDAVDYIATLPNIKGIAVGVSKIAHAQETFSYLRKKFAQT